MSIGFVALCIVSFSHISVLALTTESKLTIDISELMLVPKCYDISQTTLLAGGGAGTPRPGRPATAAADYNVIQQTRS